MITIPSANTMQAQVLAFFATAFPGRDTGDKSYLGQWARVLTEALLGLYQSMRDAETGAVPSTSTATDRLTEFAVLFGLPDGSGTPGKWGRKVPVVATGGAGSLAYSGAGPFPYTLAAGQVLVGPDGATRLVTTADVVWAAAGSQPAFVSATTAGTAGNFSAGAVLSLVSPPAGVATSLTLTTGLSGGADGEDDGATFARLQERLQNPPKGGSAADWRAWAESVVGVSRAYVYPRRGGTGTVDVVCMQSGSGLTRVASSSQLAAVLAVFDANRLVTTENRRAMAPGIPAASSTSISVRITPTPGNEFDWDSRSVTLTIDTVVNSLHLKLSGLIPADLQAAIEASAVTGVYPRIQVLDSGSALPIVCACSDSTDDGVKTTVTLTAPPAVTLHAADEVYAGSNAVLPVAIAILATVDALGPSLASTYGDTTAGQTWDDTLRIDAVRYAGMSTGMVLEYVTTPTIDGDTRDKAPGDDMLNPPAFLYASPISVLP